MATTSVDLYMLVVPSLDDYGVIPFNAPRTEAALAAAEEDVWIGPSSGTWNGVAVETDTTLNTVKFEKLFEIVELKLEEYESHYNTVERELPLRFQLASQVESDVYYYNDHGEPPQIWCSHRWTVLAAPADGGEPLKPWVLEKDVTYKDGNGGDVTKPMDIHVAFGARFVVDEQA